MVTQYKQKSDSNHKWSTSEFAVTCCNSRLQVTGHKIILINNMSKLKFAFFFRLSTVFCVCSLKAVVCLTFMSQ